MDGVQVRTDQVRADPGWWAQSLTSTLIVGPESLQLLETWTVVAEMPLDEVLVPLNLDLGPEAVVPPETVLYGGELSADPWPQRSRRLEIAVRLPKMLDVLDRHDFGLRLVVPAASVACEPPAEHLCRPMVGCRSLVLRVRFQGAAVPSSVHLVGADGDTEHGTEKRKVDAVGEVVVRFTDLPPGAVRGVRWKRATRRR